MNFEVLCPSCGAARSNFTSQNSLLEVIKRAKRTHTHCVFHRALTIYEIMKPRARAAIIMSLHYFFRLFVSLRSKRAAHVRIIFFDLCQSFAICISPID